MVRAPMRRLIERHVFSTSRGVDLTLTEKCIRISYIWIDRDENWRGDLEWFDTDSWTIAQEVFNRLKSSYPRLRPADVLRRLKKEYSK